MMIRASNIASVFFLSR